MPYDRHGIRDLRGGIGGRRPFEVTADTLELARKAGKLGFNKGQLAKYLSVSDETLRVHAPDHPELLEAYEQGKLDGVEEVAGKLYQNATEPAMGKDGPTGPPGGNVSAQMAYLKQVGDWRDKVQVSGDPNAPLQVHIVLPDNGRVKLPENADE